MDKYLTPFQDFNTEAKRLSYFKKCGTFIPPETVKLGEGKGIVEKAGEKVLKIIDFVAQFILLQLILIQFFELPGVYHRTLEYFNEVRKNAEIIRNITQGSIWEEMMNKYPDTVRFPIECYFDDYENNNPLGSHKGINKCGALYVNLPILPSELSSKVENIFMLMLFDSKHRVKFSNKIIFMKVIDVFQRLKHEGTSITVDNKQFKIYFDLILCLGNNLGLHSIFGLNESFSSNKFCRFCLTDRKNLKNIFNERDCELRNETNYESLLSKNDGSVSGIKEP